MRLFKPCAMHDPLTRHKQSGDCTWLKRRVAVLCRPVLWHCCNACCYSVRSRCHGCSRSSNCCEQGQAAPAGYGSGLNLLCHGCAAQCKLPCTSLSSSVYSFMWRSNLQHSSTQAFRPGWVCVLLDVRALFCAVTAAPCCCGFVSSKSVRWIHGHP